MGKQCKHPTCGEVCRRIKEKKKPKPLKKATRPIKKESKKRKQQKPIYQKVSREVWIGKQCAIKAPGCTGMAQGANHLKGRTGDRYTDKDNLEPACNSCNGYIEKHPTSPWGLAHKIPDYTVNRKIIYKNNNMAATVEVEKRVLTLAVLSIKELIDMVQMWRPEIGIDSGQLLQIADQDITRAINVAQEIKDGLINIMNDGQKNNT